MASLQRENIWEVKYLGSYLCVSSRDIQDHRAQADHLENLDPEEAKGRRDPLAQMGNQE